MKQQNSNSHQNYFPTLEFIEVMVQQDRLELFAGDCPLEDVKNHLEAEIHYTICHYFRCKRCDQYFFIGACIRGTPIYKTMDKINTINFDNMLWGQYGKKFEQKK